MFMLNLLLMLAWAALTGNYSFINLVFGFIVSYLVLWKISFVFKQHNYFVRMPKIARLFGYFIWELILSNLRVTYDILTVKHHMRPAILAIPLDLKTDVQITLLANMITLTPGTLSLDVSEDRSVLYVHHMYIVNDEDARRKIKDGFERRILEIFEP